MKDRIFTDLKGEQLIVRHRKSAVFFHREADLTKENRYKSPYSDGEYVEQSELVRKYYFDEEGFKELLGYLETVALESWKGFEPKDADSMGADYYEYYDTEFDNNGYLSINSKYLRVEAPNQLKENGSCIRMYKFNKRKFESFIYDFRKQYTLQEV
ncbi:hypothetical protein D7X33_22390 [Butyricicoccus sp. 1XD8-22]|nr:hypothetical protein D7X33_22390 [Butyricicoccus sp. 1XD8-22]